MQTQLQRVPRFSCFVHVTLVAAFVLSRQVSVDGGRRESAWQVAVRLNEESGPGVFWEGLGPKVYEDFSS
jgi:hypothetical protein